MECAAIAFSRCATVPLGDGPRDGKSQAAAGCRSLRRAVETLEDALALGTRDTGPAVDDAERDRIGAIRHAHLHGAARGCIAHGVVDEIARENPQGLLVAGDQGAIVGRLQRYLHASRYRLGCKLGQQVAYYGYQVDHAVLRSPGGRIQTCQRQQLIDQV